MEFLTAHRKAELAARRATPWLKIDMSALLAVLFALLYLLMAPIVFYPDLPRHLANQPTLANAQPLPGASREDAIIITVTRDGRIFLPDSEPVSLEALPSRIHEAVGKTSSHHVYLNADERAKYSDVEAVVAKIGEAGIKNVSLLAWQATPR